MPRKARAEVEGGLYHVITRGNNRQQIFNSPADHEKFLSLLAVQKTKLPLLPAIWPAPRIAMWRTGRRPRDQELNQFNGNFLNAEMVKAFITSDEYRNRFGP